MNVALMEARGGKLRRVEEDALKQYDGNIVSYCKAEV